MISKEIIEDTINELQESYLIPANGKPTLFLEEYNKTIISTIEDLIKLKLYLKDLGHI